MAEWSELNGDLIHLIADHLNSEIDLVRFRSICNSWRSSASLNPSSFPLRLRILPNDGITQNSWGFYLSKDTVYLIGLPRPDPETPSSSSWLIKLERDSPNRVRLLNPLSRSELNPLPPNFPTIFDFWGFRVQELGHEYTLRHINFRPLANSIGESGHLYMEKVALACSIPGIDGFVLLTIHVSGRLVMLKSGDKRWNIINDFPSPYDDVIFYDGHFYAVDHTGRTVIVDINSPSKVCCVAQSVFGGDKKFLVESRGDLLLVDMYLSIGPGDDLGYNDEAFELHEEINYIVCERTVSFKVFKLDQVEQKWVEVTDLGDEMLFLADNCTFSVSASNFSGCKGNCILFTDLFCNPTSEDDEVLRNRGIGLFDLKKGCIEPLANCSGYSEMFWPPPSWVLCTSSLEAQVDQLNV